MGLYVWTICKRLTVGAEPADVVETKEIQRQRQAADRAITARRVRRPSD